MNHTSMKLAALLTVSLAAAIPGLARADASPSPWTVKLGPAQVNFSAKADVQVNGATVPGANASASNNTTLGMELSYDISPSWTGHFLIGVPPTTTLKGTGALDGTGTLGKAQYGPAVLSATYKLLNTGPVQPYVGAGLNYTIVFKSEDGFISHLNAKSAFGSVLELGAEVPLDNGWSLSLDARKIFLKTTASGSLPAMGGAAAHADLTLDPLVIMLSVGKRF